MINVRKNRGGNTGVNIDMGPLVDMVFLLLIFFVVTTSFVKESGIDVQRASAATAELKQRATVMIGVSPEGQVYFEGKQVDVRSVRGSCWPLRRGREPRQWLGMSGSRVRL